ncbi:hypothetical protein OH76DRAFT_1402902 [Lentinus brumalis]|uniref:Uncharacterized protein n=1 Tax=Lentinus brumalis TaxID=2498619 RepID=A0A371DC67_9APHY|nr:hypothetical protein OH76DRAFT_1402902 [Polyporus brumalis]
MGFQPGKWIIITRKEEYGEVLVVGVQVYNGWVRGQRSTGRRSLELAMKQLAIHVLTPGKLSTGRA